MPIDLVLRIRKIDYILKLSVLLEIHVIKKAKTRFLNSKSVVVLKQSQKKPLIDIRKPLLEFIKIGIN